METLLTTVTEINESLAKAAGAMQDQVLAAHRDAAAALAKLPEAPAWMSNVESPAADVNVGEIVKQAYDFQVGQLEASRKFTLDLVDIWTAKPAARSAKKS